MKSRKMMALALGTAMLGMSLTGCGSENKENQAPAAGAETSVAEGGEEIYQNPEDIPTDVEGEITVLSNRTDIVDTVFAEYTKRFNEKYPNVKVNYETMEDYEGDVQVRMSTTEYGDVLLMPTMDAKQYPDFFLPLGDQKTLQETYRTLKKPSYEGVTYGLPTFYVTTGVVYNKKVFENAGITELPATQEDFLAAMQKIKDKGDAIPYYTNYSAGWPLNQWEDLRVSVAGDTEYLNKLYDDESPFDEGKPQYQIFKLMYDLVKNGYVEEDPITSSWDDSKQMLADGKIGAMVLGEWAVSQIKDLADNPDDIGFMPFPQTAPDGKQYACVAPDYCMAVNKNTKYPNAAKAYLWWFINESGYAEEQSNISPKTADPLPDALKGFEDLGVQLIYEADVPAGKEGLVDRIDNQGQIGLYQPDFKQRIIDAAMGNTSESFDEIMDDLNARWKQAMVDVAAQQ